MPTVLFPEDLSQTSMVQLTEAKYRVIVTSVYLEYSDSASFYSSVNLLDAAADNQPATGSDCAIDSSRSRLGHRGLLHQLLR